MNSPNVKAYRTIIIASYNFLYNFGIAPKNYIIFLNLYEFGVES